MLAAQSVRTAHPSWHSRGSQLWQHLVLSVLHSQGYPDLAVLSDLSPSMVLLIAEVRAGSVT